MNRSQTLVFYRVWTDLSFLSGKRTSTRACPLDPRAPTRALIICTSNNYSNHPNKFKKNHMKTSVAVLTKLHWTKWMDGWMICDFTSFSTVFQSYQDDGQMIMKGCVQWNLVYG